MRSPQLQQTGGRRAKRLDKLNQATTNRPQDAHSRRHKSVMKGSTQPKDGVIAIIDFMQWGMLCIIATLQTLTQENELAKPAHLKFRSEQPFSQSWLQCQQSHAAHCDTGQNTIGSAQHKTDAPRIHLRCFQHTGRDYLYGLIKHAKETRRRSKVRALVLLTETHVDTRSQPGLPYFHTCEGTIVY